jgi:methionine aminotransferase
MDPRRHARLQDILAPTDVLLISDGVWYMVFDAGKAGSSCAASFGPGGSRLHRQQLQQNLPCYRLEVGCGCTRGADSRVPQVHQFNIFHGQYAPVQHAAAYMANAQLRITGFYHKRRPVSRRSGHTRQIAALKALFFNVDISSVSDLNEAEFCRWLTVEVGVAALLCRRSTKRF